MIKVYLRKIKRKLTFILTKNSFRLPKSEKPKAFIFGIPDHANLGDQAIAIAENNFIKTHTKFIPVLIEFSQTNSAIKKVKKKISKNDVILLHGGGNLGDLYLREENLRRTVISTFSSNKVVVFPQSSFFKNDDELVTSQKIYSNHQDLTIFARDHASFIKLRKLFPSTNIKLSPDIVISLPVCTKKVSANNVILLAFRQDIEINDTSLKKKVKQIISKKYNFYDTDTVLAEQPYINSFNRNKVVRSKLREFSNANLVVTDRLHGMIFSFLTNTPCIVFNNSTGKVKNFYQSWFTNFEKIVFMKKFDESLFLNAIEKLLKINTDNLFDVNKNFKNLKETIDHNE
mgnify:CR=1 FL=1